MQAEHPAFFGKGLARAFLSCYNKTNVQERRRTRFRFEDSEHQLHTVHITEIIDSRFVEYVGIETFVFLCKALFEGAEKLYELRYTVRTHRWTLFREVY